MQAAFSFQNSTTQSTGVAQIRSISCGLLKGQTHHTQPWQSTSALQKKTKKLEFKEITHQEQKL